MLRGPAGIVVSPGGGEVFVASGLSDSVTVLRRNAGGLEFESCVSTAPGSACAPLGRTAILAGAAAVAVGPGGSDVYVASVDAGTVTHLRRRADGNLALADCVSGGPVQGCRKTRTNPLAGADALALSADGRDLYVAAYASNSLVRLHRGRAGRLAFAGCIADDGANNCAKLPHGTLAGAAGVAVSADGRDVYVTSQAGTVTRLHPLRQRGLAFAGCFADADASAAGCARAKRAFLSQPTGIVVGPDGRDVYVAAQKSGAIVHLVPGRHRSLRFAGCSAPRRAYGCASAPASALRGPYALALSPGGRDLFATAGRGAAVSAFARR